MPPAMGMMTCVHIDYAGYAGSVSVCNPGLVMNVRSEFVCKSFG